jgi:hypothetical protein
MGKRDRAMNVSDPDPSYVARPARASLEGFLRGDSGGMLR